MTTVREDFDRIALLPQETGGHNAFYHRRLLRALPARIGSALDVGCGRGAFTRLLADRAERVVGIDFSPEMIDRARRASSGRSDIDYRVVDARDRPFHSGEFDCVASLATLHHLPLAQTLRDIADVLAVGGTMLILDLLRTRGGFDPFFHLLGLPLAALLRLRASRGRWRLPAESRRAWERHSKNDAFVEIDEIRRCVGAALPQAVVRRHLLWRYSISWRKP
jgi:SAM-dependent methyltransferase